jgi:hypothetical protein
MIEINNLKLNYLEEEDQTFLKKKMSYSPDSSISYKDFVTMTNNALKHV